MSLGLNGLNAQDALAQIAKMAYGSGSFEGVSGGKGNVGLVDGRVVKFNTHWTERLKSTTPAMQASCNAMRLKLGELAAEILHAEGVENGNEALADIRAKLGLDPQGRQVVATKLLDRKIVASVVNTLAKRGAFDAWAHLGQDDVRPLASRGVDTTFQTVAERARIDALTVTYSSPRADMSALGRQAFADDICNFSAQHRATYFTADLASSFVSAEKDLPRGQTTILNGAKFGGGAAFVDQSAAYRATARIVFAGNEGLLRLFNGMAHQGFFMSALAGRLADEPNCTAERKMLYGMPFVGAFDQNIRFDVRAQSNGDYTLRYSFLRCGGTTALPGTADRYSVDKERSGDWIEAEVCFGPAQADDSNARQLTFRNEQGNEETIHFHLEVVSASTELTLAFTSATPIRN